MNVELKNHWFDGTQLRSPGVQEIPETFRDILPSTAIVLEEEKKADVKEPKLKL